MSSFLGLMGLALADQGMDRLPLLGHRNKGASILIRCIASLKDLWMQRKLDKMQLRHVIDCNHVHKSTYACALWGDMYWGPPSHYGVTNTSTHTSPRKRHQRMYLPIHHTVLATHTLGISDEYSTSAPSLRLVLLSRHKIWGLHLCSPLPQYPLGTTLFSPVDTELSTSHTFFKEAKCMQEQNKWEVLDELLCNEDNPSHCTLISTLPFPTNMWPTLSAATPTPHIASTSSVSSPVTYSQMLPSWWMNTFHPPPSPSARASLDSLFDHHTEPLCPHSIVPVKISHHTSFAPHGSTSETSSVMYIPLGGAPRYHRESYSWDKEFSKDLELFISLRKAKFSSESWTGYMQGKLKWKEQVLPSRHTTVSSVGQSQWNITK